MISNVKDSIGFPFLPKNEPRWYLITLNFAVLLIVS
jgi:hypothetical protein